MIDPARLENNARAAGITLSKQQLSLSQLYASELVSTNELINLTAITDPEGVENKHLIDCFMCASAPETAGNIADVGTGAGLPGIAIKILKPECAVTFIEATAKKLAFVEQTAKKMELDGCRFVHARAEELGVQAQWRESYDCVTARAVASLSALAEYCLPLVKPGGNLIALKGPAIAEELLAAKKIIAVLGGGEPQLRSYTLPSGEERCLVIIKKISHTPTKYPRKSKDIIADAKKKA